MTEDNSPETTTQSELTDGQFAYKILADLSSSDRNVMLSPVSIRYILNMAAACTSGSTRSEILRALGYSGSRFKKMKQELNSTIEKLNSSDSTYKSNFKNAVFYDKSSTVKVKPTFLNLLQNVYRAETEKIDFSASGAEKKINAWVANATDNRIKKVLDNINDEEFLFLLNAFYIKADWLNGFDKNRTTKGTFVSSPGNETTVQFMHKTQHIEAVLNENVKIVRLPLAGKRMTATFLMPVNQSLQNFIETLSPTKMRSYEKQLSATYLDLKLPKVKMKYHAELTDKLKNLGIKKAFQPSGNFNPLTNSEKVYLSRVLHDTYFEMDEKGIEGAAVTTAGVGITSLPERVVFDHPFVISIMDTETNSQIFLGAIKNPGQKM